METERYWAVAAAVLLAALAPRSAPSSGHPGSLEVACEAGRVSLSGSDVPADQIFAALERSCGLIVRRAELVPAVTVTVRYEAVPLEEAVRDLVRLAGVPSTLSASGGGGPLVLVLLPTGSHGPAAPRDGGAAGAEGVSGRRGLALPPLPGGDAVRAALSLPPGPADAGALLALLRSVDQAEAWVAEGLSLEDLLQIRGEAAARDALRRFHGAADAAARDRAFGDLLGAGPSPETGGAWTEEEVAEERWRVGWEAARLEALLGPTAAVRQAALERLQDLNPDEAGYLEGLDRDALAVEQHGALVDALLERYYLARTPEEWRDASSGRGAGGGLTGGSEPE